MPVIGGNADGLRGEKDATCRLALRMKTAWAANLPNLVGGLPKYELYERPLSRWVSNTQVVRYEGGVSGNINNVREVVGRTPYAF